MQMKLSFDLNQTQIEKEMKERFEKEARESLSNQITRFFRSPTPLQPSPGIGFSEIETMMINKASSPEFKDKFERWFEQNWERIFEEQMKVAMLHRAKAMVWSRSKNLPKDTP